MRGQELRLPVSMSRSVQLPCISSDLLKLAHPNPFRCEPWPSAIAMSEQLLQRRDLVAGRRVCELGCGLGLAGLAAAVAGGAVEWLPGESVPTCCFGGLCLQRPCLASCDDRTQLHAHTTRDVPRLGMAIPCQPPSPPTHGMLQALQRLSS